MKAETFELDGKPVHVEYEVTSQVVELSPGQFNAMTVTLAAQDWKDASRQLCVEAIARAEHGRGFDGQRKCRVRVFPRPSAPIDIPISLPTSPYKTHSADMLAKTALMSEAVDFLSRQGLEWLARFVLPVPVDQR